MESINEDDYDYAVSKIIIGPKKNSDENHCKDDIFFLINEIREQLKDSPATIFPFIESCSRNADSTVTYFKMYFKNHDLKRLKSEIRELVKNHAEKWILWDDCKYYSLIRYESYKTAL